MSYGAKFLSGLETTRGSRSTLILKIVEVFVNVSEFFESLGALTGFFVGEIYAGACHSHFESGAARVAHGLAAEGGGWSGRGEIGL